jgi:hypothetical protein
MKRFDWPINREGGIFGSENERAMLYWECHHYSLNLIN